MKILIVDDETLCRNAVKLSLESIQKHANYFTIAEASNTKQAEEQIQSFKPDIVMLDIEMPKENGIDFLNRIGKISFEIIFITAYQEYAIEAFKQNALAYLLKPFEDEDLKTALLKCQHHLKLKRKAKEYSYLKELVNNIRLRKLAIPSQQGLDIIELDKIIYISAAGSYTEIHSTNQAKPYVISKNIKHLEATLPSIDFIRVHDSKIINKNHIIKYIKGSGGYLVMTNDIVVDVSKRKKEALLKNLLNK